MYLMFVSLWQWIQSLHTFYRNQHQPLKYIQITIPKAKSTRQPKQGNGHNGSEPGALALPVKLAISATRVIKIDNYTMGLKI